MKICVTTIYTENLAEMLNITAFKNFREYCNIHGYDLEVVKLEGELERSPHWYKIKEVKKILQTNKYDWVFFIDLDCLFMNTTIKLESFIDDINFLIIPANCDDVYDCPVKNKYGSDGVISCQFLIKNCKKSIQFLDDVWNATDVAGRIDEFDHEQRQLRYSVNKPEYKEFIKIVDENIFNTYWYTNDVFTDNFFKTCNKNIWKEGDFIVHVPGYHARDRIRILSDLSYFSGGLISLFKREDNKIYFSPIINLNNVRIDVIDNTIDMIISTVEFDELLYKIKYWISILDNYKNITLKSYINNELIGIKNFCDITEHFDFIEIGTSDFDTLIENADDLTTGLSIDPMRYYLDKLPNKKNVKKLQYAISDIEEMVNIYSIGEDKIIDNNLPYWVKGCNSIGKPHNVAVDYIGESLFNELVTIDIIQTITLKSLISKYNVKSIDYLKIDTEGYDHLILNQYFSECKKNPSLYAKKIKFEYDVVFSTKCGNKEELDKILNEMELYDIVRLECDVLLVKKDNTLEDLSYFLFYRQDDRITFIPLKEFNNIKIDVIENDAIIATFDFGELDYRLSYWITIQEEFKNLTINIYESGVLIGIKKFN